MGKKQQQEIDALRAECRALTKVVEMLAPKEMIESLLSGITPLFLGYKDGQKLQTDRIRDVLTGMSAQGLDESAGVERGVWFPDVEFDESMEAPERWPEPGTISGIPNGSSTAPVTTHRIAGDSVARTDNQPMFRAGTTAPPPDSGIE